MPLIQTFLRTRLFTMLLAGACLCAIAMDRVRAVTLYENGQPRVSIHANTAGTQGGNETVILDAANHLARELARTGQPAPAIAKDIAQANQIILARADQYPQIASQAGLDAQNVDAYAIVPHQDNLYILGSSAHGVQHGAWALLHHLGYRYYAPSPTWQIIPTLQDVSIDKPIVQSPALRGRSIWYAYGVGPDKSLGEQYKTWAVANRLPSAAPFHNGHAYGNIVSRNKAEFDKHPEYFALLENGERDTKRALNARKFCTSNPGLIQLVIADRLKLLEERKAQNPYEFMVSVDPSDGQGTCHCENCARIGTTTNRVIHLANQVAKALREKHPDAWVGLYAYSSHRVPPTIDIEPNVYVQVALGFNRTEFTLPELVSKWAEKLNAIGLREYYGVEAWDWGLPGRMRGAQADYHEKWIPWYARRKLNAINAETNANWAGQTPGLYVASRLMWNPQENVDKLTDHFYQSAYGSASETMRAFHEKLDEAPQLQPAMLRPLFDDLAKAYEQAGDDQAVKARIVDMMAYMHYIMLYRDFNIAEVNSPERGDEFYNALKPLMQYAWQIRMRDIVHYYALARRLVNGLPLTDGRFEFWYALNGKKNIPEARRKAFPDYDFDALPDKPVWMTGEQLRNEEIIALFKHDRQRLENDHDVTVMFTRYFDFGQAAGADAGPSKAAKDAPDGSVHVKGQTTLYFVPGIVTNFELQVLAKGQPVTVTTFGRGTDVIFEEIVQPAPEAVTLSIPMPRPGEYRTMIQGEAIVTSQADVPMVYEASPAYPMQMTGSGPLYFYVPRGVKELMLQTDGSVTLQVPGGREVVVKSGQQEAGQSYISVPVQAGEAGKVWQLRGESSGALAIINAPPLLWTHRENVIVPREVSMSDGVTTFIGENDSE